MKKVILAGNAIAAEILYSYLKEDNRYAVIGSTVDDGFTGETGFVGLPCIGISRVREVFPPASFAVVMAVGYGDLNRSRASIFGRMKEAGYEIETYVHPDAKVYTRHALGEGCVVLPSAVIETEVQIGANSVIWCNAVVAHHATVGEHCWIASGAVVAGQACIGSNTFIGVNATVVNSIAVGELNMIGAGAMISKDTKPNSVHLARSAEELRFSAEDYIKHFGA